MRRRYYDDIVEQSDRPEPITTWGIESAELEKKRKAREDAEGGYPKGFVTMLGGAGGEEYNFDNGEFTTENVAELERLRKKYGQNVIRSLQSRMKLPVIGGHNPFTESPESVTRKTLQGLQSLEEKERRKALEEQRRAASERMNQAYQQEYMRKFRLREAYLLRGMIPPDEEV